MSVTQASGYLRGDEVFLALIGHTYDCAVCRVTAACPTAVRLAQAWREARR